MTTSSNLLRSFVTYALILPVALLLGYLVATPFDFSTMVTIGVVMGILIAPILLKWHHPLLIVSWNMIAVVGFLPGRPDFWLVMSLTSLLICIVQKTLVRDMRFIPAFPVLLPLIVLGIVIYVTGKFRGGFGLQSMGSSTIGGRRYWSIMAGMAGFLAMTAYRIPPHKAGLYVGLFFLGALASGIGTIIFNFLPFLSPLLYFFPASDDLSVQSAGMVRFNGLGLAFMAVYWYLLARYGITEMLGGKKFRRFIVLILAALATMASGYRSHLVAMGLAFFIIFYLEGLFRSKYAGLFIITAVFFCVLIVPFANKLPLTMQRSLSVLPIEIDQQARDNADESSEWRLQMWKEVLPEVPKYLWLGKGLVISQQDMDTTDTLSKLGHTASYAAWIVSGDYHNGPLTLVIPFGIWGFGAFIWFILACIRALNMNRLYGPEHLRNPNTFILTYFVTKAVFYFFVFGNFYSDFPVFTGLIGLSLSLNHGIHKPVRIRESFRPIPIRVRAPVGLTPGMSH